MSYYTVITKAGLAAITAAMNSNSKVGISFMAFGDGNGVVPIPSPDATSLINEVYRVNINSVKVHEKNPNWLVCEAIIPSAVGGFNIREVALYDPTGQTMLANASYPPTYKPTVEEGAARIQTIRIVIQVDNAGNFELIIDPDIVLATIQAVLDVKKELYENTVNSVETISDLLQLVVWDGRTVQVKSYHSPLHALLNPFRGGDEFVYVASRANENDGGTVINGWVRKNIKNVSPLMFGAKADGNNDDTEAFKKCIASKFNISLGASENIYKISETLTLLDHQKIDGVNAVITSGIGVELFKLSNGSKIKDVRFINTEKVPGQIGISVSGKSRTSVTGCHFEFIDNAYKVTDVVDHHQGNIFSLNTITLCGIGANIENRGEYTSITGNNIDQCLTAIRIRGGNTNVTGGIISDNGTAIEIVGGSNDAHGRITGVLINHNVTAVKVDSPTVPEFHISDCSFYYGNIHLKNAKGIYFKDCTFSTNTMFFENAIDNFFQDCVFYNKPTINHRYNNTQSKTHFIDCIVHGEAGTSSGHMNGGYVSAIKTSPTTTIAANTDYVVLFNQVTNAMPFDVGYTFEQFYNPTTGLISNLNQANNPNNGFYCTFDLSIAAGFSNSVIPEWDKLHVFIINAAGDIVAICNSSNQKAGAGSLWKQFSFNGRLSRGTNYYVKVVNESQFDTMVFFDQPGSNVRTRMAIADI